MAEVTIKALPNGPYLVQGEVTLIDSTGQAVTVKTQSFALCRCGGSGHKPFCDGTHGKIGFKADEAARPPA